MDSHSNLPMTSITPKYFMTTEFRLATTIYLDLCRLYNAHSEPCWNIQQLDHRGGDTGVFVLFCFVMGGVGDDTKKECLMLPLE